MSRVLVVACVAVSLLATPAAGSLRSPADGHFRFDLAAASIDGHPLLGNRVSTVTSALGPPTTRSLRHKRYGSMTYGKGYPAKLSVIFRLRGGVRRVTSLAITSRGATEALLGKILRVSPRELQQKVARAYAGMFRLVKPFRCTTRPASCSGLFKSVDGKTNLSFGMFPPRRGAPTYLVIYD